MCVWRGRVSGFQHSSESPKLLVFSVHRETKAWFVRERTGTPGQLGAHTHTHTQGLWGDQRSQLKETLISLAPLLLNPT